MQTRGDVEDIIGYFLRSSLTEHRLWQDCIQKSNRINAGCCLLEMATLFIGRLRELRTASPQSSCTVARVLDGR